MIIDLKKFIKYVAIQDFLILSFLIITSIFSWIAPFSDIIKGILSSIFLVLMPYLIGKFTIYNLNIKKFIFSDLGSMILFSWIFGSLIIMVTSLFLSDFNVFNLKYYIFIIYSYLILSYIFLLKYRESYKLDIIVSTKRKLVYEKLIIFFVGLLSFLYIVYWSPYPYFPTTDVFNFNRVALNIIESNSISFSTGYLPYEWIITAISSFNFNVDPFSMAWITRLLFCLLFPLGIFYFVYQFSKNRIVAVISSILSVWIPILGLNQLYYYGSRSFIYVLFPFILYFISKNFLDFENEDNNNLTNNKLIKLLFLLLFISILFSILSYLSPAINLSIGIFSIVLIIFITFSLFLLNLIFKKDNLKRDYTILALIIIFLISIHITSGLILSFLILICIIISYVNQNLPNKFNFILILFVSIFTFFFIKEKFTIFNLKIINFFGIFPNPEKLLEFSFSNASGIFLESFPAPLYLFGFLGFIFLLYNKSDKISNRIIIFLFVIESLVYLLPINFSYRILYYSIPFVVYFISISIYKLGKGISRSKYYLFMLFFLLIILFFSIQSQTNYISNAVDSSKNKVFSTYDIYEYNAYNWIKHNLSENILIISDRQTTIQANGIADKGYIDVNNDKIEDYQNYLKDVLSNEDPEYSYKKIKYLLNNPKFLCKNYFNTQDCKDFQNREIIVIIGEKTSNFAYNGKVQWFVKDFVKFKGLKKFFNETYFTEIYNENDKIYIFALNPKIGIPYN